MVATLTRTTKGWERSDPAAGAPWRDVPDRYGPWDWIYDLFRRWQRDGNWARIVTQLQAEPVQRA
ncbi:transposase [Streptomyces sp. NPDC001933]|uniref:transposase n=1 Tax=Streptomyces sp. NPDC001933 TaxID=3364626 RepID=UPI00369CB186